MLCLVLLLVLGGAPCGTAQPGPTTEELSLYARELMALGGSLNGVRELTEAEANDRELYTLFLTVAHHEYCVRNFMATQCAVPNFCSEELNSKLLVWTDARAQLRERLVQRVVDSDFSLPDPTYVPSSGSGLDSQPSPSCEPGTSSSVLAPVQDDIPRDNSVTPWSRSTRSDLATLVELWQKHKDTLILRLPDLDQHATDATLVPYGHADAVHLIDLLSQACETSLNSQISYVKIVGLLRLASTSRWLRDNPVLISLLVWWMGVEMYWASTSRLFEPLGNMLGVDRAKVLVCVGISAQMNPLTDMSCSALAPGWGVGGGEGMWPSLWGALFSHLSSLELLQCNGGSLGEPVDSLLLSTAQSGEVAWARAAGLSELCLLLASQTLGEHAPDLCTTFMVHISRSRAQISGCGFGNQDRRNPWVLPETQDQFNLLIWKKLQCRMCSVSPPLSWEEQGALFCGLENMDLFFQVLGAAHNCLAALVCTWLSDYPSPQHLLVAELSEIQDLQTRVCGLLPPDGGGPRSLDAVRELYLPIRAKLHAARAFAQFLISDSREDVASPGLLFPAALECHLNFLCDLPFPAPFDHCCVPISCSHSCPEPLGLTVHEVVIPEIIAAFAALKQSRLRYLAFCSRFPEAINSPLGFLLLTEYRHLSNNLSDKRVTLTRLARESAKAVYTKSSLLNRNDWYDWSPDGGDQNFLVSMVHSNLPQGGGTDDGDDEDDDRRSNKRDRSPSSPGSSSPKAPSLPPLKWRKKEESDQYDEFRRLLYRHADAFGRREPPMLDAERTKLVNLLLIVISNPEYDRRRDIWGYTHAVMRFQKGDFDNLPCRAVLNNALGCCTADTPSSAGACSSWETPLTPTLGPVGTPGSVGNLGSDGIAVAVPPPSEDGPVVSTGCSETQTPDEVPLSMGTPGFTIGDAQHVLSQIAQDCQSGEFQCKFCGDPTTTTEKSISLIMLRACQGCQKEVKVFARAWDSDVDGQAHADGEETETPDLDAHMALPHNEQEEGVEDEASSPRAGHVVVEAAALCSSPEDDEVDFMDPPPHGTSVLDEAIPGELVEDDEAVSVTAESEDLTGVLSSCQEAPSASAAVSPCAEQSSPNYADRQ